MEQPDLTQPLEPFNSGLNFRGLGVSPRFSPWLLDCTSGTGEDFILLHKRRMNDIHSYSSNETTVPFGVTQRYFVTLHLPIQVDR
jgi:hypothetical protein